MRGRISKRNNEVFCLYSARNSASQKLRRRSSHDNSNAVNNGSLDDSAIKEEADKAL